MTIQLAKAFWPLTISASNCVVYFKLGATDYGAFIEQGTYTSAADLLTEIAVAMNAKGAGGVFTATIGATGRITITNSGFPFELRIATFTTNSASAVLGFFSLDTASATSHTASFQHANGWYPDVAVRFDSLTEFERDMDRVTVAMSGQNKRISETELEVRRVDLAFLDPWKTRIARETTFGTNNNEALERLWRDGAAKFRWWEDASVEGVYEDYFLDEETVKEFKPERMFQGKEIYAFSLLMRGYVA